MMSSQDFVLVFQAPLEFAGRHALTAYLDGGTGSMVMQVAVSGLLAAAFVYRSAWAKVKGAFKRIRPTK
jgi:hypothetical protein